jgi:hypothetical protein
MAQVAALEAMQKGEEEMLHMKHEYDLPAHVRLRLNRIGLDCFEPKGAFTPSLCESLECPWEFAGASRAEGGGGAGQRLRAERRRIAALQLCHIS